jgi:hypothetical protein
MARKKAVRVKRLGTRVTDYPESMSMYERESLAAEAILAEMRKKTTKRGVHKLNESR